uniref:Carboxylic ester hydrolase n=1 Tax=Onchocerca volvulus TaxID=6282 RepID=A0A8R1Y9X4_ONCVO
MTLFWKITTDDPKKSIVELQTRNGMIRGYESFILGKRVRSFLSVPFAEPPIGDNRFRPPIPKKPWKDIIDATILSPACYQGRDTYDETFWGSEMWNANTPVQEDCLRMNIWAPADAHNLTIMVWLFGGGYYSGSPSLILYDGKAMAVTGNVIIVNINYRLGPFGYLYLDHDDVPGNMGMLDQQLALQWIHDNIVAFGGNPSRITLFGESAGAASIVAHLIAPGSRGLFERGILQSGSLDNRWSLDSPQRAMNKSLALAKHHDCQKEKITETIECLKSIPAAKLIDGMWNNLEFLEFPFVIVSKDRNFFKQYDAYKALRNGDHEMDVDLMIGINHDEGNYWNIYYLSQYFDQPEQPLLSQDEFLDCLNTAFKQQSMLIRQAAAFTYMDRRCENIIQKNKFYAEQINQMVGDYFFTCDSIWLADHMKNGSGKIYVYYFDQRSSANPWPKWAGVMHGYEIEFVFGVPLYNRTAPYTNQERIFSEKILKYWTNFANYGDPDFKDQNRIRWPEYHKTEKWIYLRADEQNNSIERRKKQECKLWRDVKDLEFADYLKENSSPRRWISSYGFALIMSFLFCSQFIRSGGNF